MLNKMMRRFPAAIVVCLCCMSLQAQILNKSKLPILVIDTGGSPINDEPKTTAHLGIIDNGPDVLNDINDPFTDYDGFIGIELRGQTSQFFPKKPYGFETRNEDGSNNNVSLLGMPAENDWVLHNPYSDKSLIRNALSYTLARQIFDYAPRTRMVEVMLNDEYQGVYLLTEKVKRDANRVDIAKLRPEDNEGDELTGGYMVKLDKIQDGEWGVLSNYQAPFATGEQFIGFIYHYPKTEDITPEQAAYLQNWLHTWEDLLYNDDFSDPENGYRQYMDVESFIDYMIINEISKNVDGYRISTFLYKDKDSVDPRIKMGPVWDYNLSFGNADYCEGWNERGWGFEFNTICAGDFWLVPFWWYKLLEDPSFTQQLEDRWKELRADVFSDERLNFMCDSLSNLVEDAAARNYIKYPDALGNYVWPNSFIGNTWLEEKEFLCDWMNRRVEWMDEAIPRRNRPEYDPQDFYEPRVQPTLSATDFRFDFYVNVNTDTEIRIFDSQGRMVHESTLRADTNGDNSLSVNARDWSQGIYFYSVKLPGPGDAYTGKIVKL